MLFKPKLKTKNKRPVAFIYAVVFNSTFAVLLVFMLLASFAIQPIHQAYANEALAESNPEPEQTITAGDVETNQPNEITEDLPLAQIDEPEEIEVVDDFNNSSIDESTVDIPQEQITDSEGEESATNTVSSGDDENDIDVANTDGEDDMSTSSDEEVDGTVSSSDSDTDDEAVDDNEISDDIATTTAVEVSTSTATSTQDLVEAQPLINDDNYYQFSKTSCVGIGDGTFHCTLNTGSEINAQSVVYADMGANKNMEIFLKTAKGTIKQLTDNEYDDTSPNYDAESRQIVWQRLIDSRYQIILYDIDEETEAQLTFSRTNNMEPKVSKSGIVWQSWDNNDWEVMYFDGKYTDQITKNELQDVAPAIHDGYILWSVLGGEEQEARVYSLDSGEILNINGYEGGLINNPRFVLVYDTQYDNGDIVTQGFDPITGLSAPIAAKPVEDPIDIPDTESTGETKALIQNKSQKNDFVVTDSGDGNATSTDGNPNSNSTTTTDSSTLNLKVTSTADYIATSTVSGIDESSFELTDYDLILLPDATADSTNTASTIE